MSRDAGEEELELDEVTEQSELDKQQQRRQEQLPASIEDFISELHGEPTMATSPTLGFLRSRFRTKSAAIRYLLSKGMPCSEIAKMLGILYQHAKNVSLQVPKRGVNESPVLENDPYLDWRYTKPSASSINSLDK